MAKILGLITARGGSKSIPRKNIKPFCGKPLIVWSIEAALKSGMVDRIVVSTDDEEIARISKEAGAEVPFMRPAELALDTTPSLPVLQHAVGWLKDNEGYEADYVLLLEPTSPARQSFHIKEAIELAETTGADSVMGLGLIPKHFNPDWQIELTEGSEARLYNGQPMTKVIRRRQDLKDTYYRNGSLYLFKPELLFNDDPSLYGNDVRGYVVDAKYDVDIDSPEDWPRAEALFAQLLTE